MASFVVRLSKKLHPGLAICKRHFSSSSVVSSFGSVDPKEVGFFSTHENVQNWWKDTSVLCTMNELRVPFIRNALVETKKVKGILKVKKSRPLEGLSLVDVGCGAGILSEPLARLGADVTGIDASETMIEAAKSHTHLDSALRERLTYLCTSIEELQVTNADMYDGVVASEVVEHVADVESFVASCACIAKPGGSVIFTTINQTMAAYLIAIAAAEGSGRVPLGTHQYNKFVKPERLKKVLEENDCRVKSVQGMMLNPLNMRWSWSGSTQVFYAIHAIKTVKDRQSEATGTWV